MLTDLKKKSNLLCYLIFYLVSSFIVDNGLLYKSICQTTLSIFKTPTLCNYDSRLVKVVFRGPIAVAPCEHHEELNLQTSSKYVERV